MPGEVDWKKVNGMLPVIVQSFDDRRVLMLGYMTPEALETTHHSQKVTFYSRTKKRLWTKGESSGNFLEPLEFHLDCDHDTLLIIAKKHGPTCHKGSQSCFGDNVHTNASFLDVLERVIRQRMEDGGEHSYIKKLFKRGCSPIAQKVGEEAVEVALASVRNDRAEILEESADLLFHLLVNLHFHDLTLQNVVDILERRHHQSTQGKVHGVH